MSGGTLIIPDQGLTSRQLALDAASADVTTNETTTSTTYTDLATSGPSITLNPGVTQNYEIIVNCEMLQSAAGEQILASVALNVAAALDVDGAQNTESMNIRSVRTMLATAHPTNGADAMKYRVGSSTGHFLNRRLAGKAL